MITACRGFTTSNWYCTHNKSVYQQRLSIPRKHIYAVNTLLSKREKEAGGREERYAHLVVLEEASDGRAAGAPVDAAFVARPAREHLIHFPARPEREVRVRVHVADVDAREVFAHVLHLHPTRHITQHTKWNENEMRTRNGRSHTRHDTTHTT